MTRALAATLCAVLLLTGCSGTPDEVVDDRLPEVTLAGFEGADPVDLGAFSGPAVISVWASWCGSCREEMPVLEEFHAAYGDQVSLLGIDFQDFQPGDARDLVKATGVTYPLVTDQAGDINGEGAFPLIRGLPYIAFVDADGTVTHVEAVVIESVDELVDMVDEHLAVRL